MAVPINRAPWNALVDDSGQNLDGSIWNKAAIKTVLLDPIDAAIAPTATVLLKQVYSDVGSPNTATGATVLGPGLLMPPLAVTDTIKIVFSMLQSSAAGGPLNVLVSGTAGGVVLIRFDDLGTGRPLNANENGLWEITIREAMVNPAVVDMLATGAVGGQPGASRGLHAAITGCNWNAGGWVMGIYSSSQAAGGSQFWSWSVVKG